MTFWSTITSGPRLLSSLVGPNMVPLTPRAQSGTVGGENSLFAPLVAIYISFSVISGAMVSAGGAGSLLMALEGELQSNYQIALASLTPLPSRVGLKSCLCGGPCLEWDDGDKVPAGMSARRT